MQRVVVDGVRRASALKDNPNALVLVPRKSRPAPLSQNILNRRIGIDGVHKTPANPRDVLGRTISSRTPVPEVLPPRQSRTAVIAFSIIASALIVASVTSSQLIPARASDDSQARQKTATSSSSSKTATIPATASSAVVRKVDAVNNAAVQAILEAFVVEHGSQYTIYVKDLKSGKSASVNADRIMLSASLYKLFVAQRIYQLADTGTLSYGQSAGTESGSTIDRCLQIMITISDNACGRDLGNTIGWSKQDGMLKNSGYLGTTLGDETNPQQTNAKDVGLLLEHLYSGTLMSPNATNRFMGLLKDQRVNDRFPSGLPSGAIIAHKTGDVSGYTHDAGIIYGAKTDFEIVVMSGPWGSPESSKAAFGILAGQLNSFFNN